MMWAAYAKSGKEREVVESLRRIGVWADYAPRVDVKRSGKQRRPDVHISPLIPNYVFVECGPERYLDVIGEKYVASSMVAVPSGIDERLVREFLVRANDEHDRRLEQIAAGERLEEFKIGQMIKIIDGPLSGFLASYRGIIEGSNALFPVVSAEVEMMGRRVAVKADPLHVRAAQ